MVRYTINSMIINTSDNESSNRSAYDIKMSFPSDKKSKVRKKKLGILKKRKRNAEKLAQHQPFYHNKLPDYLYPRPNRKKGRYFKEQFGNKNTNTRCDSNTSSVVPVICDENKDMNNDDDDVDVDEMYNIKTDEFISLNSKDEKKERITIKNKNKPKRVKKIIKSNKPTLSTNTTKTKRKDDKVRMQNLKIHNNLNIEEVMNDANSEKNITYNSTSMFNFNKINKHPSNYNQIDKTPCSAESMSKPLKKRYRLFLKNGSQIVFLKVNTKITLEGIGSITRLFGSFEIYGYRLLNKREEHDIFSYKHHGLITLTAISTSDSISFLHCWKNLEFKNQSKAKKLFLKICHEDQYIAFLLKNRNFLLFERLRMNKRYHPVTGFPNQVKLHPGQNFKNALKITNEYKNVVKFWINLLNTEEQIPVLIMCGGKNSGKSTLARYFVNCTLNEYDKVAFLECDIGQSEFSPPGHLSLNIVYKPVLGPPYTHQQKPVFSSFAGFVNPSLDPVHYMECLKLVHGAYVKDYSDVPLIVNTMGWNQGLGLSLFVETLKLVDPSMLVQLDGPLFRANFPLMLPKIINNQSNIFYNFNIENNASCGSNNLASSSSAPTGCCSNYNYSLHCLKIPFSTQDSVVKCVLSAADFRNLTLFSNFIDSESNIRTNNNHHFCNMPLYKVPLSCMALHVCHEEVPNSLVLNVFNGRMCSLCMVEEDMIIKSNLEGCPNFLKCLHACESKGIGVVYSIDMQSRCIHLATNVSPNTLNLVNCLMVGAIDLPKEMFDLDSYSRSIGVPYLDYQTEVVGEMSLTPKGKKVPRLRPMK